jgi:4-hydroxy-tetrahydrodipicolinate reductase
MESTSVKIGLFGYGKMGKTIEGIAQQQGSAEIVWKIDEFNRAEFDDARLRTADVAIEFTRPEAAFDNVMSCLRAGVPVVSGTTGWLDHLPEAQAFCQKQGGALLWASNFSIGVNLFFAVNRYVAALMDKRPEYAAALTETHHIHKLDAPSGTALTLALDLIEQTTRHTAWKLAPEPAGAGELPVTALREGEVPGTHTVAWHSAADSITLTHTAHSRAGFASGALLAARWLAGRKGVFSMNDVLGI